jgi:anti-anti-sigma regulatory factor
MTSAARSARPTPAIPATAARTPSGPPPAEAGPLPTPSWATLAGPEREPWRPTSVVLELVPEDLAHCLVELHRLVSRALLDGPSKIIVDVSRLDCLSSTTMTALLWAHRRCRTRGASVLVRNPTPRSMELLIRTGVWHVLDVELGAPVRRAGAR